MSVDADKKVGDSSLVNDTFERRDTEVGTGKHTPTERLTSDLPTGSAVQRKSLAGIDGNRDHSFDRYVGRRVGDLLETGEGLAIAIRMLP